MGKLSQEVADAIRASDRSAKAVAETYAVTPWTVYEIKANRMYADPGLRVVEKRKGVRGRRRKERTLQPCECGCGEVVQRRFAPGHSMRSEEARERARESMKQVNANRPKLPGCANWVERDMGHSTPCHLWMGKLQSQGYAQETRDRRCYLVHRERYEREVGPIPEGLHIDHLCRVPHCVRPSHLEPVTNAENIRRSPISTKLTKHHAIAIRQSNEPIAILAERYGVSVGHIQNIRCGHRWVADMEPAHA
jgi:hypothetical protein